MNIVEKRVSDLIPYANNPRNNVDAVDAVAASIAEFGFKVPMVIDSRGVIVAGHTRLLAARRLGLETVPCVIADDLTDAQIKAFRLADNKVAEIATWDPEKLDLELQDLTEIDMEPFGFETTDAEDNESAETTTHDRLESAFLIVPFSVLNGDSGPWMDRKRAWLQTGIHSSRGRGGKLAYNMSDEMQRQAAINE